MTDTNATVTESSHDGPESAPHLETTDPGLNLEDEYAALLKAVGNRVRVERAKQGWKFVEFAQSIKISQSTLSRLERGERFPRGAILLRICCALNIQPSILLAQAEDDTFPLGSGPWERTTHNRTAVRHAAAPKAE